MLAAPASKLVTDFQSALRFPQWWMLLVAILAILSGQGSLLGMERFAQRHRKTLNELLGTQIGKPPSQGCLKVNSGTVFGELYASQREYSLDVVGQRAQTLAN
jgi:hypothetical protein